MNLEVLTNLLGQNINSFEFISYCKSHDINLDSVLPDSDGLTTYLELPEKGICLTFEGYEELWFSGFFLYSDGYDDYSEFQSSILFNLNFGDTRENILSKLGESEFQSNLGEDHICVERWDMGKFKVHVTYSNKITLSLISIFKPRD